MGPLAQQLPELGLKLSGGHFQLERLAAVVDAGVKQLYKEKERGVCLSVSLDNFAAPGSIALSVFHTGSS